MTGKPDKYQKKILLLTSAAGGGHVQAAKAKTLKALRENPNASIIQKDLLVDCVNKPFGKLIVRIWNFSQKKGYLKVLTILNQNLFLADFLCWIPIFIHIFRTLIKEDVDQVIDTQPVGTSAIIKAIRCAKYIKKKPILLEKIVTELPTDQILYFFKPIKALSANDRNCLQLITTAPLLKKDQTAEAFWQKNCNLSENEVSYEDFPLRPIFEKYKKSQNKAYERMKIYIQFSSLQEKQLIENTIKKGTATPEIYLDRISLSIEPDDKVSTILLGSQPTEEATIKYVTNFIAMAKKMGNQTTKHQLFVFCNQHSEQKNSLLKRIHDLIQKIKEFPKNLNIIPMCFQGDDVIAPLYYRSNATFTRSGGLTAMELMTVAQGQIWIHSELKITPLNKLDLSRGMPVWERGNAYYLKAMKGAEFITPDTFCETCASYFFDTSQKLSS